MLTVSAPAKVNTSLYVTGKRPDGYHEILSDVVFTELGDTLTFEPSELLTLKLEGEFAAEAGQGGDNLVLKAAAALNRYAGTRHGARMTLTKHLPVGAGLGGGSADAAATLKALNDFWQLGIAFDTLLEIGLGLGADVPMCLHSKPLVARGLGELIVLLEGAFAPAWFVLVHPRQPLLTKDVFDRLRPEILEPSLFADPPVVSLADERNDLQEAAIAACPIIREILQALAMAATGQAQAIRMTGSGACCFALFYDEGEAQACFTRMQAQHPDWWVALTRSEMP